MIEYQNIFTQVQVQGKPEWGMDDSDGELTAERAGKPFFSKFLGLFGNAQVGPINAGMLGIISAVCFMIWFNIVGFSMLAQVGWSVPEFLRQLFWLALEPPGPEHGLSMPPLNDGGAFIIAGMFFLVGCVTWWLRTYQLAQQHKMGKHLAWAFAALLWLILVLACFVPY